MRPVPLLLALLTLAQAVLGIRSLGRMARTAGGERIARPDAPSPPGERVSVIVPTLDETARLGPCLDGLAAQGPEVAEVLVADGGSTDGTRGLVAARAARDGHLRLVDAAPVPAGVNGKAHGLAVGLAAADPGTAWVLTMDADVRSEPGLVGALVAQARRADVPALSAATRQVLSGPAEALLHPAMLATLVYRLGIPGHATDRPDRVQANGQCFLVRRDVLAAVGGFDGLEGTVSEDVALARRLAAAGHRVGFHETEGLVSVAMYAGWREAWEGWTRSLPLRDGGPGYPWALGLAEVVLVQALPLPLAGILARSRRGRVGSVALALNAALVAARLGVLAGTARAYVDPPPTYWLSPLADLPVALRVARTALRREHTWRGRRLTVGARADHGGTR